MNLEDICTARNKLNGSIRDFFLRRSFIEVETPLLWKSPGVEAHIDPFEIVSGDDSPLYLIHSPEFQMKCLTARFRKIFQITRSFRKNESSPLHNPEFSILEWYRSPADIQPIIDDLVELLEHIFTSFDKPCPSLPRVSYDAIFEQHLSIVPSRITSLEDLRRRLANVLKDEIRDCRSLEEAITLLYVHRVEPELVKRKWSGLVYPFPSCFPTLAAVIPNHPELADRVELYIDGIEIANGFTEINDIETFLKRLASINRIRLQDNRDAPPADPVYLERLRGKNLPQAAGIAVGIDRLLMKLLDLESIDEVILFPLR